MDVGYVIPDEGALAWLDCWAITRDANNPALAYEWIDSLLEPQIGKQLTQREGLANTMTPVSGVAAADASGAGPQLVWIQPVESIGERETLWHRIESGDRLRSFPE